MDKASTRTMFRRPKTPSMETSTHKPERFQSHNRRNIDASGEPLVEDFQTRFMSHSPGPRSPGLESLPGIDSDLPSYPSFDADPDDTAPPPINRRDLNISSRASSRGRTVQRISDPHSAGAASSEPTSPDMHDDSSRGSLSEASTAPTIATVQGPASLAPLQTKGPPDESDRLDPILDDDPRNFDLLAAPPEQTKGVYQLEIRGEQLFSPQHLSLIFRDPKLLLQFTGFLNSHRPQSIRTLIYYLDALKALRAIRYANAVAEALEPLPGHDFSTEGPGLSVNPALQEKANSAFELLAREDLPAWVSYTWTQIVSLSIQRRITGTLAPHLREASEGLAEVFCLSDPSRPDNPIVFASEEFQRTTQYGLSYCVGRNCRFLQGPRTEKSSIRRLADACRAGKEHSEVFLNYRRDGSPFMNLLMIAPLNDSKGNVRYFIGAQVDVSGLVRECTGLDALRTLVEMEADPALKEEIEQEDGNKDEFQALSEMYNTAELDTVRRYGGRMHRDQVEEDDDGRASIMSHRPRLLISDPTGDALDERTGSMPQPEAAATRHDIKMNGRLQGVYQHYLLIRPHPSMRILFTSPSLRVPGITQSPFLSRIGGSTRIRNELTQAFSEGRGVTAKIRWLTHPRPDADSPHPSDNYNYGDEEGRTRWIHCTPLLGHTGSVGVWMVVLVDEEGPSAQGRGGGRFRPAPPVDANASIRRKQEERMTDRERLQYRQYQLQQQQQRLAQQNQTANVHSSTTQNQRNNQPGTANALRSNPNDMNTAAMTEKRKGVHAPSNNMQSTIGMTATPAYPPRPTSRNDSYLSTTSVRPVSRAGTSRTVHSSAVGSVIAGGPASGTRTRIGGGAGEINGGKSPEPSTMANTSSSNEYRTSKGSDMSFALR